MVGCTIVKFSYSFSFIHIYSTVLDEVGIKE